MPAIPLIRASQLIPIVDFLNHIGSPTDRLLKQVDLSLTFLEDPDSLIPLFQSSAFLERAAQREGLETLGILIGQNTPICKLGALGQIVSNSLTLFDLLITVEQVVSMANSGERCSLRWEKDWVWLQHHCLTPTHTANLQTQRYDLMIYLNALRMALGPTWKPTEIYLEGPPCRELLAMDDFWGIDIHFLSPFNAIKIPRAALSLPINPIASPDDLTLQPEYVAFQQSAPAQDFNQSLRQLIGALLPHGYPDIAVVAESSGLSVRSLQRQLAETELPYSQLVDQVRLDVAVTFLKQPKVKLIDLAAELGYTDQGNFTRAFKRWTGVSPKEYRLTVL